MEPLLYPKVKRPRVRRKPRCNDWRHGRERRCRAPRGRPWTAQGDSGREQPSLPSRPCGPCRNQPGTWWRHLRRTSRAPSIGTGSRAARALRRLEAVPAAAGEQGSRTDLRAWPRGSRDSLRRAGSAPLSRRSTCPSRNRSRAALRRVGSGGSALPRLEVPLPAQSGSGNRVSDGPAPVLRGPASKPPRLYASQMNSGNSAPPKAASGTRGMPCRPVAFASR